MYAAKAQTISEGLRSLADWIDVHHVDLEESDLSGPVRLLLCRINREQFIASIPLLDGQYEIDDDGKFLNLIRRFGPLELHLYIEKDRIGERVERMRTTTDWELAPEVAAAIAPEAVA